MTVKQQILSFFWLIGLGLIAPACRAEVSPPPPPDPLHYADLADLSLPAEIIAKVRVLDTIEVKPAAGAQPLAGRASIYVSAEIETLIKGPQDMPRAISFMAEQHVDDRGRFIKLKKTEQLIFARSVPQRSGFVQLNAPDAMVSWSPERESVAHAILIAAAAADSPPVIRGVDNGFSVAGTVPGERETQVFLSTNARPVSLAISHHPNEDARWSVALGEIVDNSAPPPARNSLLWYQLACHLPHQFPEAKLADKDADQAQAIRADYSFVINALGPCDRGR